LLGQKRVKWRAADLTTPSPSHLPILRFRWGFPTSRGRSRPNGVAWRVPNRTGARVMARAEMGSGMGSSCRDMEGSQVPPIQPWAPVGAWGINWQSPGLKKCRSTRQ
jgi:hypothetical protein